MSHARGGDRPSASDRGAANGRGSAPSSTGRGSAPSSTGRGSAPSSSTGRGSAPSSSTGRGKLRMYTEGTGFEAWGGYMHAKKQKLQEQVTMVTSSKSTAHSDIFKGIAIFVNGYTKPSSSELKKVMLSNGGKYHHYYSRSLVTHIIASNLPNSKVAALTDKKVCGPEWITDSLKAGRLLPYQDYLLYTGRGKVQPGLSFCNKVPNKGGSEVTASSSMEVNQGRSEVTVSSSMEAHEQGSEVTASSSMKANEQGSEVTASSSMEAYEQGSDAMQFSSEESKKGQSTVIPASNIEVPELDAAVTTAAASSPYHATASVAGSSASASAASKPTASSRMVSMTTKSTEPAAHRSAAKAGNRNFVSEFYSNSRLHYLSTWGAELREYVNELQGRGGPGGADYPGRERLHQVVTDRTQTSEAGMGFNSSRLARGHAQKVLMHLDMDCFFVSVGLRNRPELKGQPVAVTHSRGKGAPQRDGVNLAYEYLHWGRDSRPGKMDGLDEEDGTGDSQADAVTMATASVPAGMPKSDAGFHSMAEIASCSYEARKAGIKNGMFMGSAKVLCPSLVTIPYDFESYREVSQKLYDIVASFTFDIEAVSCDEMLIDCTDVLADTGATPHELASLLRQQIFEQTQCPASAGMATSILVARMATRVAKPNGQHWVNPDDIPEFIRDKPVAQLPGVGRRTSRKLETLQVQTCADLQTCSLQSLQTQFGPKTGQTLYSFSRGHDDRTIKTEKERKSVSAEINYGIRFTKDAEMDQFVMELAEEVHNRLSKIKVKGKTICLKVKVRKEGAPKETAKFLGHGVCDSLAKSSTLAVATDDPKVIAKECLTLLQPLHIPADDIRGVGIQVTRLESPLGGAKTGTRSIRDYALPAASNKPSSGDPSKNAGPKAAPSVDAAASEPAKEQHPANKHSSFGEKGLPPLPMLPVFTSPTCVTMETRVSLKVTDVATPERRSKTDVPRHATSEDDLDLPSPSQIDPDVLRALPPDLQRMIAKRLGDRKPQPRCQPSSTSNAGTLPNYGRAKARQRTGARTSTKVASAAAAAAAAADDDDDDEDGDGDGDGGGVIRHVGDEEEEEEEGYVEDGEVPGCSRWEPETRQRPVGQRQSLPQQQERDKLSDGGDKLRYDLPSSYSQLDRSVLAALPPELRDEVEQAYKQHQQPAQPADVARDARKPVSLHPLMDAKIRNSPVKSPSKSRAANAHPRSPKNRSPGGRSPGKASKRSPLFKVPVGRAPGSRGRSKLSPKKLDFRKHLQPTLKDVAKEASLARPEPQKAGPEQEQEQGATEGCIPVAQPPTISPGPSLCGAVTLAEVKALLAEWVATAQDVEDEDGQQVALYLGELVQYKDLERVDLLLKYLHRCTRRKVSSAWQRVLEAIVDQTQVIVQSLYGGTLKLNFAHKALH